MPRTKDVRPDRVDLRDRPYQPPLVSLPPEFPTRSDLDRHLPAYREAGLILDQGSEGACTGFGLAAVINYLLWRHDRNRPPSAGAAKARTARVSPRMLYHLARLYDEWPGEDYAGSSCRGAMKGWHHHGICREDLWPYWVQEEGKWTARYVEPSEGWIEDAARRPLGAYYRIDKDSISDMQAAIHEVGAIYVSAQVHSGWNLRTADSLPTIKFPRRNEGGHAFALVGYTEEGFIVQNSWSGTWGWHGFAVMSYRDWAKNGMDAWVAVMGASVALCETVSALSSRSLAATAAGQASLGWRPDSTEDEVGLATGAVRPWTESEAYRHTVVIGNDGKPLNRLVECQTAADAIRKVVHDHPLAWSGDATAKRLAIYAHGGLNEESASLRRTRVLAPYFKTNGIYPIFVTWRTGIGESLGSMLTDAATEALGLERAEGWLGDTVDALKQQLEDARNRSIELAAERLLVKGIWSQIKQNAAASILTDAGGQLVIDQLVRLAATDPKLEIHLIGHSAGSLLHGHLLDACREAGLKVHSVTLFAPACTLEFALEHYGGATTDGTLSKKQLFIENLSDERERTDRVGPYTKSLLYLVSRALEVVHKKPLLGMQVAWRGGTDHMRFEDGVKGEIREWKKFSGHDVKVRWHDASRIRDSRNTSIPIAHGSFDNDIDVIERTIKRIAKRRTLDHRVVDLRY